MPVFHIVNQANILDAVALTNEDNLFIQLAQVLFGPRNVQCLQWLAARRLIANSRICNVCAVQMTLIVNAARNDGYIWRCRNCRHTLSLRHGSSFTRGHLSMQTITAFVYLWCSDTPLVNIMHELDINSWHTAVYWANFCREVCTRWIVDHPIEIGGMDHQGHPVEVEIDESYFNRRKYHRGQRRPGRWVFGGVERGSGRCFTEVVVRRDAATLLPLIQRHILPGTRILSDMWQAYATINQLNNGMYLHDTVNHTLHFVDPQDPTIHTQNVEGMWAHTKRKLRHQFGTSRPLFAAYLDEYVWRKAHPERKFAHFLQCLTEQYPV